MDRPWASDRELRALVVTFTAVATAYALGAQASWHIFAADIGLAFFPPAGVTLAALLLSPRRRWPAVILAIVVAEIGVDVDHGLSLAISAGYAVANAVEPIVGALAVNLLTGGRIDLSRRRDMARFIAGGVLIGPAVGAVIGASVKTTETDTGWLDAAVSWWAGDGLGVLALAAAIMTASRLRRLPAGALAELVVTQVAVAAMSIFVFWVWEVPPAFVLLPLLLVVAVRAGVPGVGLASALMAITANYATASGRGPFAALDLEPQQQLDITQLSIATLIVAAWYLAVETSERTRITAQRQAERAARERAEATQAIGSMSADLAKAPTVDAVTSVTVEHLSRNFGISFGVINLYDQSADRFSLLPQHIPDDVRALVESWSLATLAPGPVSLASGQPVWLDSQDELVSRFPPMAAIAERQGLHACGALPLEGSTGRIGYLFFTRPTDTAFTPHERDDLVATAQIVAQAVQRAQLYDAERATRLEAERAKQQVDVLLRRSEQEARRLAESEQRFRAMSDQSPLLVWVHDTQGRPEWVNERFLSFFGVTLDQVTDPDWRIPTKPADDAYWGQLAEAVSDRKPFRGVVQVARADGQWRWLESWGQPRWGSHGEFLGHIGTSADVTDRFVAEEVLRATASLEAFKVRLADTLRRSSSEFELEATAARLLGERLGVEQAFFAEVDHTGSYGIVRAAYRSRRAAEAHAEAVGEPLALHPDVRAGHRLVVNEPDALVVEPVVRFGRVVAALVVRAAGPRAWLDADLLAVEETARRAWTALEELRAQAGARRRHERAVFTTDLVISLESGHSFESAFQRVVDALVPEIADYATIESVTPEHRLIAIAHRDIAQLDRARSLAIGDRLFPAAIARAADAAQARLVSVTDQARSALVVPLELGDDQRGGLALGRSGNDRDPFTADDLAFVAELAQKVSVALAQARVRKAEHDVALTLQHALLPDAIVWHPDVAIEARYHAASEQLEVGGDWYDTFMWPDGRIGVMIGDVVGHSLESAAAMGRLRSAAAALAGVIGPDAASLIDALDRFARGPGGATYATVVCLVVDPARATLTYCSAGHPPALLVHPDGTSMWLDGAQSSPLCAMTRSPRPETTVALRPGSLVVAYSDGLIERRHEVLDEGMLALETVVRQCFDRPIAKVADRLVAEMAARSVPEDDVVVACVRYTPQRARTLIQIPARSGELRAMRAAVNEWLGRVGVNERDDIILAVGEAAANAVEHAYAGAVSDDDVVDVELADHGYRIIARVTDHGRWRVPPRRSDRGRGTFIMGEVSDHLALVSDLTGTTVTLEFAGPGRDRRASLLSGG